MYSKNVIDISNDAGFSKLASIAKETGGLPYLPGDLDLMDLIIKQASQDSNLFADPLNRRFSVATPIDTYISSKYASQCYEDLSPGIIDKINEACNVFNIVKVEPIIEEVAAPSLHEMFGVDTKPITIEKEASESKCGSLSYGTEFETCLAARAALAPEEAEGFAKLASLKDEIEPTKMASIIQAIDERLGFDMPWVQSRLGTPEYAVFEKKASLLNINLGGKAYPIEKLASQQEVFESMGIQIDLNDDPYTVKIALEKLPNKVQDMLTKVLV